MRASRGAVRARIHRPLPELAAQHLNAAPCSILESHVSAMRPQEHVRCETVAGSRFHTFERHPCSECLRETGSCWNTGAPARGVLISIDTTTPVPGRRRHRTTSPNLRVIAGFVMTAAAVRVADENDGPFL